MWRAEGGSGEMRREKGGRGRNEIHLNIGRHIQIERNLGQGEGKRREVKGKGEKGEGKGDGTREGSQNVVSELCFFFNSLNSSSR
jgi:hypothetical protein